MTIIESFSGKYRFLSNFYPSKLTWSGQEFATVEHLYQARKSPDPVVFRSIALAPTASETKRLGRTGMLYPDWDIFKYDIMYDALTLKFSTHSELADSLVATENRLLVEGNTWHDQVWGQCTCPAHRDIAGQNALGILLMRLRLTISAERR